MRLFLLCLKVTVYHPNEGKGFPLKDRPPPPPEDLNIYSFDNLPGMVHFYDNLEIIAHFKRTVQLDPYA